MTEKEKAFKVLDRIKDIKTTFELPYFLRINTGNSLKFCQECVEEYEKREKNANV